jgi:hypothetical protein
MLAETRIRLQRQSSCMHTLAQHAWTSVAVTCMCHSVWPLCNVPASCASEQVPPARSTTVAVSGCYNSAGPDKLTEHSLRTQQQRTCLIQQVLDCAERNLLELSARSRHCEVHGHVGQACRTARQATAHKEERQHAELKCTTSSYMQDRGVSKAPHSTAAICLILCTHWYLLHRERRH